MEPGPVKLPAGLENEPLLELFFYQSLDGFFFMMLDEPVEWGDHVDKDAVLDFIFEHQRLTKVNAALRNQFGGHAVEAAVSAEEAKPAE